MCVCVCVYERGRNKKYGWVCLKGREWEKAVQTYNLLVTHVWSVYTALEPSAQKTNNCAVWLKSRVQAQGCGHKNGRRDANYDSRGAFRQENIQSLSSKFWCVHRDWRAKDKDYAVEKTDCIRQHTFWLCCPFQMNSIHLFVFLSAL